MALLFAKEKLSTVDLVKLPYYCRPTEEVESLAAKRDAQLKWMRQNGMRYLGDPMLTIKRPTRLVQHNPAA